MSRKVLIVSDRQPATQVDGQYGKVLINPISDVFLSHARYRFKVQVNPVRKDKQSGKRIAVKGRVAIAEWFLQRATNSWGFEADPQTLQIDAIDVLQFKDKAGRQVTLGKAHIQGQLTVTNLMQFHNSFKSGIGKGRAFGCGLLQIVPIIDNPFA
ncbi:type I-E CRISPR-associated protein Cas6/Cse3/CasE [Mangrovibacter sp. SLW1]